MTPTFMSKPKAEKRGGGKGSGSGRPTPRMRRWKGRRIKRDRKYPPPIFPFGICRRCSRPYEPEWSDVLSQFSRFCEECQCWNLFEHLGMTDLLSGVPPEKRMTAHQLASAGGENL